MAIDQVQSNGSDYADSLPASQKLITLRKNTADDPLTWDQNDNNFEILRSALNYTIQATNELGSLSGLVTELDVVKGKVSALEASQTSLNDTFVQPIGTQVSSLATNQATIISNQQSSEELHTMTIAKVAELEGKVNSLELSYSSLLSMIGEIATEHVARTYVRNDVFIKWNSTATEAQINEITVSLGLVYDSDVPLTSFKMYRLPLDGRRDAGYVIPILALHEHVDKVDYNGTAASY